MEVVIPAREFHFDSSTTTPYLSAPSTPPLHFGSDSCLNLYHQFNSAPTSPTAVAAIYAAFPNTDEPDDSDFGFSFDAGGRHLGKGAQPAPPALTDADELFELGMIRPLKLPPRLYTPVMGDRSPKSPRTRGGLLSPQRLGFGRFGKDFDPFAVAMVEVTRDRGRHAHSISNSRSRKGSRSISPFRGRGIGGFFRTPNSSPPPPPVTTVSCRYKGSVGGGRKWSLKNLLLFRSSSKPQTTRDESKDRFCNYTSSSSSSSSLSLPKQKKGLSEKNSRSPSFRSSDSGSMRRGAVSPHEMHDATELPVATADETTNKMPLLQRQSLFKFLRHW